MSLKKRNFGDDEFALFDEAIVYKRGEYWQMRMWLVKEQKYARFSLRTRNKDTAADKAKKHFYELKTLEHTGRTYFSKTCKDGVEEYLKQRLSDVEAGLIVQGRYGTIRTHLQHWLDFIGRDTKLKELERTDCENYFHSRTKTKKNVTVSQTTVANEQSTINAMIAWLYKRNETYIEKFDFKPLKRVDRGDENNRRASFTDDEIADIKLTLEEYIKEARLNINEDDNLVKAVTGYYLLCSIITGLRRGEQLQLRWCDIEWIEHNVGDADDTHSLVQIVVRGETSKVGKTRKFVVKDSMEYFDGLFRLLQPRYVKQNKDNPQAKKFAETLIFSTKGNTSITPRAISYHFNRTLELAEIKGISKRDLVPYSFRHYFITQRVNSNLPPAAVAEMCGTSITQIDKTYYHTTREKMISNAIADYYYNKDGLLIPK
jgi:integrase